MMGLLNGGLDPIYRVCFIIFFGVDLGHGVARRVVHYFLKPKNGMPRRPWHFSLG